MILTLTTGSFPNNTAATQFTFDFKKHSLMVDGKQIEVELWDTAGQEQFRTITNSYYRNMHGFLLIYDVTNTDSFNDLPRWVEDLNKLPNFPQVVVIGAKCDLLSNKVVSYEDGMAYAKSIACEFFEISSQANINLEDPLIAILKRIIPKNSTAIQPKGKVIVQTFSKQQKTKKSSCLLL